MSRSSGTGSPLFLKCSTCKKTRDERGSASTGQLVRIGRERPYKPRGAPGRTSKIAYECECLDCGNVGWYAHKDAPKRPLKNV